jgi:uncharacterized protein YjbI with pentapeptide repeats
MTSPQAEEHDADALATAGEKSPILAGMTWIPSWDALLSRSKQPGRLRLLGRRVNHEPPWWVSQIVVALLIGLLVGGVILFSGNHFSDLQARHQEQLENLRFVRDRAEKTGERSPFAELNLQGQNLSDLVLPKANFSKSFLSGANLEETNLVGADLEGANLKGAHLHFAKLDGANLAGADLTDADLTWATLSGAILSGANLTRADFQRAWLNGVTFSSGEFQRVKGVTEQYSALPQLTDTNLSVADLTAANLAGVDLRGIRGGSASLGLTPGGLQDIYYDASTKWPNGFRPPLSRPNP